MSPHNNAGNKIVLVVEDNIAHRNLIEMGLMEGGVDCCTYFADSTAQADARLEEILHEKKHAPDLIMLDNKMPGTDGMDYLLKLRKKPETSTVPIIIMTAAD